MPALAYDGTQCPEISNATRQPFTADNPQSVLWVEANPASSSGVLVSNLSTTAKTWPDGSPLPKAIAEMTAQNREFIRESKDKECVTPQLAFPVSAPAALPGEPKLLDPIWEMFF